MAEKITFNIRLADVPIGISAFYHTTRRFCRDYLTGEEAVFAVDIRPGDIAFERQRSADEDRAAGQPVRQFPDSYLETLAVYRQIAEKMPDHRTMLFHGSAVAVDGQGYLFTASSGTGKSTHTRLWREVFGSRAVMINDDKPLLRVMGDGVTVWGTPWDGKHRISSNLGVPLRAICILERDKENHIERIPLSEAWPVLMQQSYRPMDPRQLEKTLALIDDMAGRTGLYRMGCNMEPSAALTAYRGMCPGA